MASIDSNELDEVLATTFKELKTAVNNYNKDSIALYSQALSALVGLRQQVDAQDRAKA
ncbi:hypothetical protein DSC45_22690 [Streptomyces sp. YIM 130001]|uniref:hypothetical protein n=1 Tax=Streptomyces sp. YIM 130001 TaxID=2259644 RepID=UPI000EDCA93A|nr:hypothetical protein [Streptomyces sp. YIM 130001]RII13765.1 hypothetical protein DSC45_22690 [Streptomyces sp. YIM 130001]